jgi:hypothetical protein
VKRLPELHLSPARYQLLRTEEGTAQDLQTNVIGLCSQHMGSDDQHTKEAFLLHSKEHTLILERGGGFPFMSHRTSQSLIAVLIRVGLLLALVVMLMAENAQAQL